MSWGMGSSLCRGNLPGHWPNHRRSELSFHLTHSPWQCIYMALGHWGTRSSAPASTAAVSESRIDLPVWLYCDSWKLAWPALWYSMSSRTRYHQGWSCRSKSVSDCRGNSRSTLSTLQSCSLSCFNPRCCLARSKSPQDTDWVNLSDSQHHNFRTHHLWHQIYFEAHLPAECRLGTSRT